MISFILPYMRCPRCFAADLGLGSDALTCPQCSARYPIAGGIPNMLGNDREEVITPFQRLMQSPPVVSIYEKIWRRLGYYLASSRSFGRELKTIIRMCERVRPNLALDLACGPGVFTRPLSKVCRNLVVGLDLSWPMLRHAREIAGQEQNSRVLFMRGSAFSLPFADSAFPYVNCCGALHLFDRPAAALAEISRVLSPGGYLSVQTTIRPARSAGFAYCLERFIRFGFFDEGELRELLGTQGFILIESERHRISFSFLAQRNSRVNQS
jgi:SAM-dependent methyltransferase